MHLVVFAVLCTMFAALFLTVPGSEGSFMANFLVGFSILFIVWLAVMLLVRFRRHQPYRIWVGVLIVLVALEAIAVGGFTAYAASSNADTLAMVQDYYTQVAAEIALSNALSDHVTLPPDITYASLEKQAGVVTGRLHDLSDQGQLGDYMYSVWSWALGVQFALILAKAGSHLNVADSPHPFQIAMSMDEVNAAVATSTQKVAVLNDFTNRLVALSASLKDNFFVNDGLRYAAARMDAQSYWIHGVYSSADTNWASDHLNLLGGPSSSLSDITTWPAPRTFAPCHAQNCGGVLPWTSAITGLRAQVTRAPIQPISRIEVSAISVRLPKGTKLVLGQLESPLPPGFDPAFGPQTLTVSFDEPAGSTIIQVETFTPNHLWPACTPVTDVPVQHWSPYQELIYHAYSCPSLINVIPGTNGTNVPTLQTFLATCKAAGGVLDDPSVSQRDVSRLPVIEYGWTCSTQGGNCWALLTFSGTEYKGGENGCPEVGLMPQPGGPILGPVASVLSPVVVSIGELFPKSGTTSQPNQPSSWDGTYTLHVTGGACGSGSLAPTLTVANNTVEGNPSSAIDSSGHSVSVYQGSVTITTNYQFTEGASGKEVTGESVQSPGSFNCLFAGTAS